MAGGVAHGLHHQGPAAGRYAREIAARARPGVSDTTTNAREAGSRFYLFDREDGRHTLAYGRTPDEALHTLQVRRGGAAPSTLSPERARVIRQHHLQQHRHNLG